MIAEPKRCRLTDASAYEGLKMLLTYSGGLLGHSDIIENVIVHRKRLIGMVWVIVLLGTSIIFAIRRPVLRAAGWVLVINDPIEAADVIVLAYNSDFAGTRSR
jgi:hypothetical protein